MHRTLPPSPPHVLARSLSFLATLALLFAGTAKAEIDLDSSAALFGRMPSVWGMRLAPDGEHVSFLRLHPEGFPIAMALNLKTGKGNLILASDPKKGVDIDSCEWANETRLLCQYLGTWDYRGTLLPATRLVAVDRDGKNMEVLLQRQQKKAEAHALLQSQIVDRLPDDPKKIWVEVREDKRGKGGGRGEGVSTLEIYKNKLKTIERPKNGVGGYRSDGRGELRKRIKGSRASYDVEYKLAGDDRWRRFHHVEPSQVDDIYDIAGTTPGSNEVLVWDWHESRAALFREWLVEDDDAKRKRELVLSNKEVDLTTLISIGPHRRAIGVVYRTERPHIEYFDETIKALADRFSIDLPDQNIFFIDESWDRRYYLIVASSDVEPDTYYRFDTQTDALQQITKAFGWLDEIELAEMKPIEYKAADGATVPAYLTLPPNAEGPVPLVVLPHGGTYSRDVWGFNRLPQYFASRGYAVLQPNYRGSWGYGKDWHGEGVFRLWRTAVSDIDAGVTHLIEKGIVDADRMCVVGWEFGGYAALISAVEKPNRYRCVVSVAGVTDLGYLDGHPFDTSLFGRIFLKNVLPEDPAEMAAASPLDRAAEFKVPVLLFHGDLDRRVEVKHSRDLEDALDDAGKSVRYTEFKGAGHQIEKQDYTIQMLQEMGDFLEEHLAIEKP